MRWNVVVSHGESGSLFDVVDSAAPEGEQPAVFLTLSRRESADRVADYLNREEDRRAARGDPAP